MINMRAMLPCGNEEKSSRKMNTITTSVAGRGVTSIIMSGIAMLAEKSENSI
jgi:hypothetical protein